MRRAIRPWISRLPPISAPISVPTADNSPSDTSEPKSRKWNSGSGLPASRALIDLHQQRGLLVRDLRARRQQRALLVAEPRRGGAVAEREDRRIARRLQRRQHDELVRAVHFETVEMAQDRPAP